MVERVRLCPKVIILLQPVWRIMGHDIDCLWLIYFASRALTFLVASLYPVLITCTNLQTYMFYWHLLGLMRIGLNVCVSSGAGVLCDSPHLGEGMNGIHCMRRSGMHAVALLFFAGWNQKKFL